MHAYSAAIQCERLRAAVFAGERSPLVFGDPPQWIAPLLQASGDPRGQGQPGPGGGAARRGARGRAGDGGHRQRHRVRVDRGCRFAAGPGAGSGPERRLLLGAVRAHRVASSSSRRRTCAISFGSPRSSPGATGERRSGLIPARYPGSERSEDDALRLARKTEWRDLGGGAFAGLGQRVLATSADEIGVLEVRELMLESA